MCEPFDVDAVPLEVFVQVDRLCLECEEAWRAGQSPAVESFLDRVPPDGYCAALYYLVLLERDLRTAAGDEPSLQEYRDRFPEYQHVLHAAFGGPPGFEVLLEVIIGPHRGRRFAFRQHDSFIVGRADCVHFQLPLKDPYFSRVHFLIEANPPSCRLTDLCSLNGTKVNGEPVDSIDLRDADLIQGGDTVMRVSIRLPHDEPPLTMDRPGEVLPPTRVRDVPPHVPGYELLAEIGQGGMGIVHRARRLADDMPVAVKVIRSRCFPSDYEVRRFLREAQILCALRHPRIVSFHQFGRAADVFYIVMDFVQGQDAAQLVQQTGPLEIGQAVRLVRQALDGLQYAHENGYVHRDIKPSNLLISGKEPHQSCQLADFGLARVYHATRMSGLTLMGDIGGTLPFMAPEQITDFHNARPAADQYGMAASLYYLCTREYIFAEQPGSDGRQLAKSILVDDPVPIEQRRADIPGELSRTIHKALAKRPEDRFGSASELHAALGPFEKTEEL